MSSCTEDGIEYQIGETQCPVCGYPILAKFKDGEYIEGYDCAVCSGGDPCD